MRIKLTVNGDEREAEAADHESLLNVLRDDLGLPGSKNACEQGECGSCSVIMDGDLVCACLVLGAAAAGRSVQTVESLTDGDRLHPIQRAFVDAGAVHDGDHLADGFPIDRSSVVDHGDRKNRVVADDERLVAQVGRHA